MIDRAGLLDPVPVLAVGLGVTLASRARELVVRPLAEADEDDDLGLQGLLGSVEDLWGGLGPVALVVFPVLTVAAFGLAVALLVLVERRLAARVEAAMVPCAHCGRKIHASAPACAWCGAPVEAPRAVGSLGQPGRTAANRASLPFQLVAVKRCPACASRLTRRTIRQDCGACGHGLMDDPGFARGYVAAIDRRVPLTLVACFLLGLVPVLGVIPGVICYRLAIVAPFRRYIPMGQGFLIRWGLRLAILALVAFQWVPLAGGLAVPIMATIHYAAYRSAFRRQALGVA